jgi:hypothetical protein
MSLPNTSPRLDFQGHDLFLIPSRDGTYILYAPTLRKLLRVTTSLAERLSAAGLTAPTDDRAIRQVLSIMQRAIATAIEPVRHSLLKSRYFHLALGLTRSCNLACLYCHADAGGRDTMTREVLEAALLHAFDHAKTQGLQDRWTGARTGTFGEMGATDC